METISCICYIITWNRNEFERWNDFLSVQFLLSFHSLGCCSGFHVPPIRVGK
jgi:hypothetical protein